MKYVRVVYSVVQEVFTPPGGFEIEDCFHPDVVSQFEIAADGVDIGFIKHQDGSFTAPPPPEIPVTDTGETV